MNTWRSDRIRSGTDHDLNQHDGVRASSFVVEVEIVNEVFIGGGNCAMLGMKGMRFGQKGGGK